MMPAQNLPNLPVDGKIQKGVLNCGVSYYIIQNTTAKGFADMALVRRDELPSAETRAQADPFGRFLARAGVGLRKEGLFTEVDGSVVFRMDEIPVWNAVILDSTLHASFSLMAESRSDQAVIISGDIDAKDIKRKMDIFSMSVPKIYKRKDGLKDYVWESSVAPFVSFRTIEEGSVSDVMVTYLAPRTPQKYMNTAQTLVMDIFAREFQTVIDHRLRTDMDIFGIPYDDIEISHVGSLDYAGDEKYTIRVRTRDGFQNDVMNLIARTLASIEAHGVSREEFLDTKRVLRTGMKQLGETPLTNAQYVDRCISSFLLGAHLAPFSEESKLFSGKTVADTTDLRFFNRIAAGILDQTRNLTITYPTPVDTLDDTGVLFDYNLAYLQGYVFNPPAHYGWNRSDTTSLTDHGPKVKLRDERTEPVSGGKMWTFSNGLRVIYKQMPGSGMFSYALQLNGGLASFPGLKRGEGGYVSDILLLSRFMNLSGQSFRNMLLSNGITMDVDVSVKDMALSGSAPTQKFPLVLSSLLTVAGTKRTTDPAAFKDYAASRTLAGMGAETTRDGIYAKMYDEIAPDDIYTMNRRSETLTPDFLKRADDYFEERFSRVNDGVLILVGDLDEELVKKRLCRMLGGFRTLRSAAPRPAAVTGKVKPGVTEMNLKGAEEEVHVLLSADLPLTAANWYGAHIAMLPLGQSLRKVMDGYGMTVDLTPDFAVYPYERLWVEVTCRKADPAGLPAGVTAPADMKKIVAAVKKALTDAGAKPLPKADLTAYKNRITGEMADDLSHSETIVSTVRMRYAMNKDLVTKYKESINAIDAAAVQNILKALAKGSRVEMVVQSE